MPTTKDAARAARSRSPSSAPGSRIVPHLWYVKDAVQAAEFYVSIFPDSRIDDVTQIPADTPSGPAGMVLVVDFTLAATRDAIRVLSWLKANAGQSRVIVVANKVMPSVQEVSRKDFEHSIERKVDILLPSDPKAAMQSAKLGQPLAKATKSSKLSQPLNQLLTLSLEQSASAEETEAKPAGGGSLLGKLGSFKSLVAKKPREASAQAA